MNITRAISISLTIVAGTSMLQSCGSIQHRVMADTNMDVPVVAPDGGEITFQLNSPQLQQFKIDTVADAYMRVSVSAPVDNLASVVKSNLFNEKLYFFETQDITDLYSSYLTSMATLHHSSLALQRTKDLYSHGIDPAKDLQDAEQDYSLAESNLADDISRLRAVGINPQLLQQTPAATVWAIADIPEEQVTDVRIGSEAELTYDAYPGEQFLGRISSVGEVIDPVTRKVIVRITLANPGGKLHPGMFGTARFFVGPWRVVSVPTTAVVIQGDGAMTVWVTPDGYHFYKRFVKIGIQEGDRYQILDGLQPGEHLVVMGGIFLSNMAQAQPSDE